MKTLKSEEVNAAQYRDLADAKARIGDFIEAVYNTERLHSSLGYLSPMEYEDHQTNLSTAARLAIPRSRPTTTTVPY